MPTSPMSSITSSLGSSVVFTGVVSDCGSLAHMVVARVVVAIAATAVYRANFPLSCDLLNIPHTGRPDCMAACSAPADWHRKSVILCAHL